MIHYILYKNPIELDTLVIVQYLYWKGYDVRPKYVIERNYPIDVGILPCIKDLYTGKYSRGIEEISNYYANSLEKVDLNPKNLLEIAWKFKIENPEYRISYILIFQISIKLP